MKGETHVQIGNNSRTSLELEPSRFAPPLGLPLLDRRGGGGGGGPAGKGPPCTLR
eukprot:NODE_6919_length_428_cov_74.343008_g5310_i0.p6 GENE.NODE_6919_length_428_cov_74.343008_g5310_i0~~NODE_6919_length_428_cov_74.343008_g5310_i0.p6  ORF type:complete len:55 (-),score=12.73 NODE_6919_length_428_cov_74.343008_g5310_i0:3-167(-)